MENHTAKHFVLQLGSLASLYLSLAFLLTLLFGITNVIFPDAVNDYWQIESSQSQIRLGIAMVLVFFPTYLILTRTVNKMRRSEKEGEYLVLTKWLVYLSLLGGGAALLGDLVAVIMTYLEGEITQRFVLKALSVFIVVGAAFYYYILDARGHWLTREKHSKLFAFVASLIVLTAVGIGITKAGSPNDVRERRLDTTQVSDLQTIQWRVQDYILSNDALPKALSDLDDPALPTAPEGRDAYKYTVTEEGFELCATFAKESSQTEFFPSATIPDKGHIKNPDNWQHGTGTHCFKRVINKDEALKAEVKE
jgi:hypothetical protein